MDAQAINNVVNPTALRPKSTASSSRSDAGASTAATDDIVNLSKKGKELAQQRSDTSSATTPTGSEQRKFEVTENNDVVLEVIDSQTQEVVRSVPSEDQLELRDAIRNELDNIDLDSI
mgnify:CR=1 FL=1|tara:strand:+ start:382 stop:735 length:354 start_codon:yes stop_codon:yes gene_type:complete